MSYLKNGIRYSIKFIDKCPLFSDCNLEETIPKNVCPFLLHNLVPYYVTYMHEGNFAWTEKSGHVDVQCPNPEGHVITDVINENKNISFLIQSSKNVCPMNYKSGLKVNVSEIFKAVCPMVYDVAFPWIQLGIKDSIKLRCSGCEEHRGIKFVLRREG
jgi:uncharacterized repeat protein (TIGR04076 family)